MREAGRTGGAAGTAALHACDRTLSLELLEADVVVLDLQLLDEKHGRAHIVEQDVSTSGLGEGGARLRAAHAGKLESGQSRSAPQRCSLWLAVSSCCRSASFRALVILLLPDGRSGRYRRLSIAAAVTAAAAILPARCISVLSLITTRVRGVMTGWRVSGHSSTLMHAKAWARVFVIKEPGGKKKKLQEKSIAIV